MCSQTSTANTADMAVMALSPQASSLRLSRLSVRAPAGMANRNSGRLDAACTSETMSGEGVRLVISHPQAAEYIQLPTLDTRVAVQITVNALRRKGDHGDVASPGGSGLRCSAFPRASIGLGPFHDAGRPAYQTPTLGLNPICGQADTQAVARLLRPGRGAGWTWGMAVTPGRARPSDKGRAGPDRRRPGRRKAWIAREREPWSVP